MAVTAMASLSYPPATERMRCAGRTAMTPTPTANAVALCRGAAASRAIRPVNTHASTEKAAGVNTHTSLRVTSEKPAARSARKIPAEVNCMPG